jgi:uncharacterized protein (TIRG00374 family)
VDKEDITVNAISNPKTNPLGHFLKQTFGYAIAIIGIIWVFHDIHFHQFMQDIAAISWGWIAIAVIFDILSYVCQGLRWKYVLLPIGDISLIRSTQAIYVGLFTNEILPLRMGEMVRAFLVSKWLEARFIKIISSIAVERLFDVVWLAIAVGLTVMFIPLPENLIHAADVVGIVALAATGLFIYLVFIRKAIPLENVEKKLSRSRILTFLHALLDGLTSGLREIGTSKSFYKGFAASAFIFVFQIIAFWLVMKGYGLNVSFWLGAVVLLIVHLGTSIPNAPSNLGSYQLFTVLGLTLFGIGKTTAAGFSVVVFVVLTIPLWALGILAIGRSGMTLYEIRSAIRKKDL